MRKGARGFDSAYKSVDGETFGFSLLDSTEASQDGGINASRYASMGMKNSIILTIFFS
jgi:hypothetical protein